MIKAAPWLIALFASITSVKFSMDTEGVKIELTRSQQRVAELENNFELASCDSINLKDGIK
jgi:hypothetical protein